MNKHLRTHLFPFNHIFPSSPNRFNLWRFQCCCCCCRCGVFFFFVCFIRSFIFRYYYARSIQHPNLCFMRVCGHINTRISFFSLFSFLSFSMSGCLQALEKKIKWEKWDVFFPIYSLALNKFVYFISISNKGATKNYYSVRDLSWYTYLFIERKKKKYGESLQYTFLFLGSNQWIFISFLEFHISVWKVRIIRYDGEFSESNAEQRRHMFPIPNWTTAWIRIAFVLKSIDQQLMNKFHVKNP